VTRGAETTPHREEADRREEAAPRRQEAKDSELTAAQPTGASHRQRAWDRQQEARSSEEEAKEEEAKEEEATTAARWPPQAPLLLAADPRERGPKA
jgi:hypothetical protein